MKVILLIVLAIASLAMVKELMNIEQPAYELVAEPLTAVSPY